MLVYIYCAALLCEECGEKCKADLIAKGEAPADPDDENSFDSDDFPKGPQEEGESDSPSYCDHCKCFLETMLTSMGRDYVEEAVNNYYTSKTPRGNGDVISEWMEFYDIPNPNDKEEDEAPYVDADGYCKHGMFTTGMGACPECGQ